MRDHDTLRDYRRDLGHTDDERLVDEIDLLLAGDESYRDSVEEALDQVDRDLARYAD